MERYKAILAYDGTPFQGFQYQAGRRTVQAVVEDALRKLGWRGKHLLSAGRTDTGVHALGQVVAFDLEWRHGAERLQHALNAALPPEVACLDLQVVPGDFHPRFDALGRHYRYSLYQAEWRDPIADRFAWQVWPALDLEVLREASRLLEGERDFRAFGTSPRPGGHTRRTVRRAEWEVDRRLVRFWIEADAFLYRMVRLLVGTLVRVGQARMSQEEFAGLLGDPPRGKAGPAAPARGLCLMRVDYPTVTTDLGLPGETERPGPRLT